MNVERLGIPEVLLLRPKVHRDDRGHFVESWREDAYRRLDIGPFVQDNASVSKRGVLRGLHFQFPRPQGKLVSTLRGSIFDVAVDIRQGSPTFGRWTAATLTDEGGEQLFVPAGFAHGFLVLSDDAVVSYKCTDYYVPASDRTIRWDDPVIGIAWPAGSPRLSSKDAAAPTLAEIALPALPLLGG